MMIIEIRNWYCHRSYHKRRLFTELAGGFLTDDEYEGSGAVIFFPVEMLAAKRTA